MSRSLQIYKHARCAILTAFIALGLSLLVTAQTLADGVAEISNRFTGSLVSNTGTLAQPSGGNPSGERWDVVETQGGYRLQNQADQTFLTRTGDTVTTSADATDRTLWAARVSGDYIRLLDPVTGKALVDNSGLRLAYADGGQWRADWSFAWTAMPRFALNRMSAIRDWTKVSPEVQREQTLLAARVFVEAPDTAESLAIKAQWARQFPFVDTEQRFPNKEHFVRLSGPKIDSRKTRYNANTTRRFVTGVWANPGEEISFIVPESMVGENISVQIGFHDTPRLSVNNAKQGNARFEPFGRFPWHMDVTKKITDESEPYTPDTQGNPRRIIRLVNGFGGVVSLVAGSGFDPQDRQVLILGGHLMPTYKLGEFGEATWDEQMARYTAPWAELKSDRISILLPSEALSGWPGPATSYWDHAIRHTEELTGMAPFRTAPDQLILDAALPPGAGAYVAGNQVTGPLDWAEGLTAPPGDYRTIFHEFGHLRQAPTWMWIANTPEVTNMIVALYVASTMRESNLTDILRESPPPSVTGQLRAIIDNAELSKLVAELDTIVKEPISERQITWKSVNDVNDYANARRNSKVIAFGLIAQTLGWDPFKKMFRDFLDPKIPPPHDNDLSRLEALVGDLSFNSGYDLTDFFELWGAPLSANLNQNVANSDGIKPFVPSAAAPDVSMDWPMVVADAPDEFDGFYYQVRDVRFHRKVGGIGGNVLWTNRDDATIKFDLQYDASCISCTKKYALTVGLRGLGTTGQKIWKGVYQQPIFSQTTQSFFHNWTGRVQVPPGPGVYELCFLRVDKTFPGESWLETAKSFEFTNIGRDKNCRTGGLIIVTPELQ